MIRRLAAVGAWLTTLVLVSSAAGQAPGDAESKDKAEARRLFEQAMSLADQNRWEQACPLFAAAHALHQTGGTSMNVARCHEDAGRKREALALYQQVLALPDQPPERVAVANGRVAVLEKALADEATTAPSPPPPTTQPPPPPPPAEPRDGGEGIGYVPSVAAFGVGGAGLVVGSIFGVLALSEMSDVESACTDGICPTELEADRDAAQTKSWVANVGLAVGVVGVAAGVVLALVASGDDAEVTGRSVRPTARGLAVTF